MAANKVVYGTTVLIDLTDDTVTADTLLAGYTAHGADGKLIEGAMFAGNREEYSFLEVLLDSDGAEIADNEGSTILGRTVYQRV